MAQELKKPEPSQPAPSRYADPFAQMRAEMDRVFDSFLGRGALRMPALFGGGQAATMMPSIDVRETDGEVIVEAELPGAEEKDVDVTVRDGVLTIKGEKKSEREEKKQDYHLMERSYGSFERSFRLPDSIDEERIAAHFDKGVLKVTLPKRPEVARSEKRIPIGKT